MCRRVPDALLSNASVEVRAGFAHGSTYGSSVVHADCFDNRHDIIPSCYKLYNK